MSEIPEDIARIATDIVRKPCDSDGDPDYEMFERIARAIMEERERCAKIAEEPFLGHIVVQQVVIAANIRADPAIRSPIQNEDKS